jgi:hypothetical protein
MLKLHFTFKYEACKAEWRVSRVLQSRCSSRLLPAALRIAPEKKVGADLTITTKACSSIDARMTFETG